MGNDITSANSNAILTLAGVPLTLEGYSVDDAFTVDAVDFTETRVGIDGIQSAGWISHEYEMSLTLEASSPCIKTLINAKGASDVTRAPLPAILVLTVPALSSVYTCIGFFTSSPPMPSLKKTLDPLQFKFKFGSIIQTPI